jgi:hypothetical protein
MPEYKIRYISGPQGRLTASGQTVVRAASLGEALGQRSGWPVERDFRSTCAWARNPGTSLYYVEAWEAELAAP